MMKAQLTGVFHKPLLYVAALIVYFFPYFFLGENSYLQVLDNMDSNLVWYHSLSHNNLLYSSNSTLVDGMIGLQPRAVYPSEWNPVLLFAYFFGSWQGFVFNFIVIHLLAFWGMWGLLQFVKKNTTIIKDCPDYLIGLISLFFGLIDFWTHAGLSAAGIPILIWGIFRIHRNYKSLPGYALIGLYVLYSNLIVGGLFALFAYFFFILYLFFRKQQKVAWQHFVVLACMGFLYMLVEYRLFYSTFFKNGYVSHRSEADFAHFAFAPPDLSLGLKEIAMYGQLHAGYFSKWTLLICFTGLVILMLTKKNKVSSRYLYGGMRILAGVIFISVILNSKLMVALIEQIPVIKMLQMDRFYFLLPCIITLFLFFVCHLLYRHFKFLAVRMGIAALVVILIIGNIKLNTNWNNWVKQMVYGKSTEPTYKSFYAEKQFAAITKYLDSSNVNYRVASIGLHPAVAVMNNLKVIDGYLSNYDIRSKHSMYEVIKNEIAKDSSLNNYFTKWGHRNYLFNNITKRDYNQFKNRTDCPPITKHLDYNYTALKKTGANYILSAVLIDTTINPELIPGPVFESPESAWTIYLYAIRNL